MGILDKDTEIYKNYEHKNYLKKGLGECLYLFVFLFILSVLKM